MEKQKLVEPIKVNRAGTLRQQQRNPASLSDDQIKDIAIKIFDLMGFEVVDDEKDVDIEPPIIPK